MRTAKGVYVMRKFFKNMQLYFILRRKFSDKELRKIYEAKGIKKTSLARFSKYVRKCILKHNDLTAEQINLGLTRRDILANVTFNISQSILQEISKEEPSKACIKKLITIRNNLKKIEL